jgi:hypothetical protein
MENWTYCIINQNASGTRVQWFKAGQLKDAVRAQLTQPGQLAVVHVSGQQAPDVSAEVAQLGLKLTLDAAQFDSKQLPLSTSKAANQKIGG